MSDNYKLVNKKPVPCSLEEWAQQYGKSDRIVAQDEKGDVKVSTVFLGLDHQFGAGPPLLFETMIFGGLHDQYQERCSTWDEAEKMHDVAYSLAFEEDRKHG